MSDAAPETPSPVQPPAQPKGLPNWHPAYLIATGFGLGHLPKAPGTWGSLAALPLAFVVYYLAGPPVLLIFTLYFFAMGWWAAHVYVKRRMVQDPSEIVIDEIAAQMAIFIVVPPTWYNLLLGFALFRLFDIKKPWPVSWADRNVGGGFGVMFDDILAALYVMIIVWLVNSIVAVNVPVS